jgi:HK97 family phage major capsid protein
MDQLQTMTTWRDGLQVQLDDVVNTAAKFKRELSPAEVARFDDLKQQIIDQDALIRQTREDEARSRRVAEVRAQYSPQHTETVRGGFLHTGGGQTYRQGDHRGPSWVRDMATVALNRDGAADARTRLEQNNREAEIELRALSTTDGAGGDFVPPVWLVSNFIALARAQRPVANRVRNETLPGGTDTLNVPRLATGTAVAEQTTQNTTIQNTDATTGAVTAAVATLAGGQTISVQMIEQSPINVDDMLLADLLADYAAKVDLFVLNNNGVNKTGILQTSGISTVTYTSASPTTKLFYGFVAQAIASVQTNRFASPDTLVMHPRRWASLLAATDTTNRPLVTPSPALNGIATPNAPASQGVVGQMQGVDVVTDPLIPTNLGAGTNQDVVIVMKADDFVLYEGAVRAEAFRDTKADSLSIYLRVYNYVAELSRYPKSICTISGTGLTPPAYDGS